MKKLTIIMVVLMVLIVMISCSRSKSSAGDVITFGLNYELTGDNPIIGTSSLDGVNLALAEINDAGGITINGKKYTFAVKPLDNEFRAESAAVVAQTFFDDKNIVAMIGPNDSDMCHGAKAIVDAGLPTITPWATEVNITKGGDYFFRACFTDDFQGVILAKYALNYENAKTAAVLYDMGHPYNLGIATIFRQSYEAMGGKVVAYESYIQADKDFSSQLTRIIAANPDILLLPNFYAEVVDQAEQAVRLGYKGKFMGSDTWGDTLLIDLDVNNIFDGCVWCGHYAEDVASPKARAFIDAYHKRYGTNSFPNDIVALNYDTVNLLKIAIENAQSTDRKAIRDALGKIEFYEGVTGNMKFSGTGDPVKSAVMIQIRDRQFKFLDIIDP